MSMKIYDANAERCHGRMNPTIYRFERAAHSFKKAFTGIVNLDAEFQGKGVVAIMAFFGRKPR
ncbi:hypothetical protein ELQ35_20760 [Peribacillus cavernae]|uniref:Uncharacterized protein n=1 Tax=Peribacillus cavernae TaxID=1674310 RepID=A0A433HA13_9BACI|nr:hypothetical protein [Peribacillus cavernae]MDQ0221430.1 hypothetical protein [Peribacillus cavernae]RUQ25103.1 hypothetical protein ELQ35_20760 [Peribacillus cavernae]